MSLYATGNAVITFVKTTVCVSLTLLEHHPLKFHTLMQSALSCSGNTLVECGAKDLSTSVYLREKRLYLLLDKNDLCILSLLSAESKYSSSLQPAGNYGNIQTK